MSPSGKPSPSPAAPEKTNPWASAFFAALFFLCSADQFFATRIGGFNIRWGQGLLLVCLALCLWDLWAHYRLQSPVWHRHLELLKSWLPFFAIYGLAALLGASPGRSLVKWAWALFNIGGSALLFLNPRWSRPLQRGMVWGVLAIALVIWVQLFLIYGFGVQGDYTPGHNDCALISRNWGLPTLGYCQFAWPYMDIPIFRPCAFYYVPSFAACALVFSLGSLVILRKKSPGLLPLLPAALVAGAALLTTARSGLTGLVFVSALVLLASYRQKQKELPSLFLKILGCALILIGLFCLIPKGRIFIGYFIAILNPFDISVHVKMPETSEGGRWASILHALKLWMDHPILGNGVYSIPGQGAGLGQLAENTWVEFPAESGLLGLLAILWALYRTIRGAFKENRNSDLAILAGACLASHFIVDLNFTATFPRLDYWLIFFFYIFLLTQKTPSNISKAAS